MTTGEITDFLAACPVFADVPRQELDEIAGYFKTDRFPAGARILEQGGFSPAVYFLRSGRLVVRVRRGMVHETVAYLQPADLFGELSALTGRPCVADVGVEIDAEVVFLEKEAFAKLPANREGLLRGLMRAIASRLQDTVSRGLTVRPSPVVLLHARTHFEAPVCFREKFATALARETGAPTLLAIVGPAHAGEMTALDETTQRIFVPAAEAVRADIATRLTEWRGRFINIVLAPEGPRAAEIVAGISEFSNFQGALLGPGDAVPEESETLFVAQSAVAPTLPALRGNRRLIWDAAEAEKSFHSGSKTPRRFEQAVDSLARFVAGVQTGVALGGGAAWGWAHIGVLGALEEAGIPVDMISGCSMGGVIGSFRAFGWDIGQLLELAEYWRTRTKRFIEWRPWRMCLVNEGAVRLTFRKYFGDRGVHETEIPFWGNAVDIQTGKEHTIRDGTLVDCVRASIALPGLMSPFVLGSAVLVDAGMIDPVPVKLVRAMGSHFTIGVNAMAALDSRPVSPRYPLNAIDVITRSMFLMGHEIGEARAEQAADVLFTPRLDGISMLQFGRSAEIIARGRKAAEDSIPSIRAAYKELRERVRTGQRAPSTGGALDQARSA